MGSHVPIYGRAAARKQGNQLKVTVEREAKRTSVGMTCTNQHISRHLEIVKRYGLDC